MINYDVPLARQFGNTENHR